MTENNLEAETGESMSPQSQTILQQYDFEKTSHMERMQLEKERIELEKEKAKYLITAF